MASEVEAYGEDATMKLYDRHKCPQYAVFCGINDKWKLKFPILDLGEEEAREEFLNNFRSIDAGNEATYMIRFYKKIPDDDIITTNTPYSSSFNFKVRAKKMPGEISTGGSSGIPGLSFGDARYFTFLENEKRRLEDELADALYTISELEEKLEETTDGKNKHGVMGIIGAVGQEYPWLQEHMNKFLSILDKIIPNKPGQQGASAGTVDTSAPTDAQVQQRVGEALTKLRHFYINQHGSAEKGDIELAQDLAKLANLTDKPMIFNAAISQLKNM